MKPPSRIWRPSKAALPQGTGGHPNRYDPYRIVSVLKRKPGTKRGEGQWETISFEKPSRKSSKAATCSAKAMWKG
jgi:tetrathionate reductase subunit A